MKQLQATSTPTKHLLMRASPPAVDNKKAVKLRVRDRGTGGGGATNYSRKLWKFEKMLGKCIIFPFKHA
jgi:hypothetical protein